MNKKPTVLFLAYGSEELYFQVTFSVLSLYYHLQEKADQLTCVVYTDAPKVFQKHLKDFPVSYEILTPEKIREYRGPQNFALRVKVCAMEDCLRKHQSKILFLDADTFCLKSPLPLFERISSATTFLQVEEYDLHDGGRFEDQNWLKIRKIVRENTFTLAGQDTQIPLTTKMWNSGIIGLDHSHLPLLGKVRQLTDQIYKAGPVFTAEQFAFSYILQTETTLQPTEDYIFHYWPNAWPHPLKRIYSYHLRNFFSRNSHLNGQELAREAYRLTQRRNELRLPPKTVLERLTFRLKIITEVALKGRITSPDY